MTSDDMVVQESPRCRTEGTDGRDRGFVLVFFALAIVTLIGIAALVVDIGNWYLQSDRIQRAADSAALAGVVFMPGDFSGPGGAADVAKSVAASNGYTSNVNVSEVYQNGVLEPHELQVTITDPDIPTFFAKVFGLDSIKETRTSIAEFQPPVPLGSAENSFGTGNLPLASSGAAAAPTGIWAAASGYCTSKENGDEYLSAFDATYTGSTWLCSATPTPQDPDATDNFEYNGNNGSGYAYAGGYSYDIVTPPSATGVTTDPITVEAFDPAFEISACTGSGAVDSPDSNNGGPTSNVTTAYDLTYSPVPLNPGQDVAVPGLVVGPTSAPPIIAGTTNQYVAASGDQTTCGLWATLFTIPAGSNDGDYRLDVSTPQTFTPMQNSDGSNVYALRVYEGPGTIPPTEPNLAGPWTRCSTITTDAWYSPTCPVVQGVNALGVYVNQSGNQGAFYLAQIDQSYAGHVLEVNLFDPGEGDLYVELIDPDTPATPVNFLWETTDDCPGVLPPPAPSAPPPDCAEDIGPNGAFTAPGRLDQHAGREPDPHPTPRRIERFTVQRPPPGPGL